MKKKIQDQIEAARKRHGSGTASRAHQSVTAATACSLCNLPSQDRQQVDRELIEETASMSAIAGRLGCSKSSVKRHWDRHVRPAVTAEIQCIEHREEVALPAPREAPQRAGNLPDIRKGVRPVVERLYEKCAEWADRAQGEASWPMFVGCIREARHSAELVARLNGELVKGEGTSSIGPVFIVVPEKFPHVSQMPVVTLGREKW